MTTVIKVENISKKYLIGHNAEDKNLSLGEKISNSLKSACHSLLHPLRYSSSQPLLRSDNVEEFSALEDVSFEIKQGDRVAIIGRNGAGKSTLLKILSRITEPTSGRAAIKGRVASLLEVGTGFHPELTGRENVYLNGAILGMSKSEIAKQFDRIVDFSGVEKFLDTPVKRFSSGMRVRLGFSVAAHLDAEVMLIDEVLAVGDLAFQRKCLSRMEEVSREGRTVVFVSHHMESVGRLCQRGLFLENGKLAKEGEIGPVIDHYWRDVSQAATECPISQRKDIQGRLGIVFTDIWTEDLKGERTALFRAGETLRIVALARIEKEEAVSGLEIGFPLSNSKLGLFTEINSSLSKSAIDVKYKKEIIVECTINNAPLNIGQYFFDIYCSSFSGVEFHLCRAGEFQIVDGDYFSSKKLKV